MAFVSCTDTSDCIRESILGVGSMITLGGLLYSLYRRIVSDHGRSNRDMFVISLSALQTLFSSIYYTIQNNGEILLACRVIKVLQTLIVSWIFLVATVPQKRLTHCVCASATLQVVFVYTFLIVWWDPGVAICRDTTSLLISIAWFVVSLIVCLAGLRLMRSFPSRFRSNHFIAIPPVAGDDNGCVRVIDNRTTRSYVVADHSQPNPPEVVDGRSGKTQDTCGGTAQKASFEESLASYGDSGSSVDTGGAVHAQPATLGCSSDQVGYGYGGSGPVGYDDDCSTIGSFQRRADSFMQVTTQLDVKKKHLVGLICVETFSAGVTLLWDLVLWLTVGNVNDNKACNYFLSHLPIVESGAYLISRAVALLVPHWTVFFVFFWSYNPHWDVDLGSVELSRHSTSSFQMAENP